MGLVLKLVPFFSLIIFFFIFSDTVEKYINLETNDFSFLGSKEKFIISLFWSALIAPIYEEVIFDGAFLKNKIFKWISYLGLLGFTLYFNRSVYSLLLLILFYVIAYFNKKSGDDRYKTYIILTNAMLFSAVHINFFDFNTLTPISLASRFGGHLLALWLVVNYKLIYAIFLHIFWNTSLILIGLFADNPLSEVKEIESIYYQNNYIHIKYNESPNFQSENVNFTKESNWSLQSTKVETLLKMRFVNSDSILNLYYTNNKRYDFDIQFRRNSDDKGQVLHFLIEDSLLIKK
ncbi:type II CAAX prenyl endopeptidase Rce1 family protein [Mesonia ostreae]